MRPTDSTTPAPAASGSGRQEVSISADRRLSPNIPRPLAQHDRAVLLLARRYGLSVQFAAAIAEIAGLGTREAAR